MSQIAEVNFSSKSPKRLLHVKGKRKEERKNGVKVYRKGQFPLLLTQRGTKKLIGN